MSNYKDAMDKMYGISKPEKQVKKTVIKTEKKILKEITEEFKEYPIEKIFKSINEGPAYEYAPHIKKIDKLYDAYWDAVKDFQEVLDKKGLKGASKGIGNAYKNLVVKFHKLFVKIVRKLI